MLSIKNLNASVDGKEVLKAMANVKIKGKSINIEPANQK